MKLVDILTENEENKAKNVYQVLRKGTIKVIDDLFNYELPKHFDRIYFDGKKHVIEVYKTHNEGFEKPDMIANIKLTKIKNGEEIPVSITGNAYIESRSIDAIQAKFRKFNFYIHL
jgi:hypothetical protein